MLHQSRVPWATDQADRPERVAQGTDTSAAQRSPPWRQSDAGWPACCATGGIGRGRGRALPRCLSCDAHDPPEFRNAPLRRVQAFPRALQQRRQLWRDLQFVGDQRNDSEGRHETRRCNRRPVANPAGSLPLTGRLAAVSPTVLRTRSPGPAGSAGRPPLPNAVLIERPRGAQESARPRRDVVANLTPYTPPPRPPPAPMPGARPRRPGPPQAPGEYRTG